MREKLKSSAGFSVVEMLCAVAVLMLLCVMLNSGLSVAMKTYFDLTAEAETQLLLNSLTNAVAGELRYAYEVSGTGGPTTSPQYNNGLCLDWSTGQVLVTGGGDDKELIPKEKDSGKGGAYKNGDYHVESMEITYDKDASCFTLTLKVAWKNSGISAETPPEGVVIRCLNPAKEEGTTP